MDVGFETCGNATLIVYDRGEPLLVTDPWIREPQYFGSWRLPYRFTAAQLEAFERAKYVWLSHGHPDHLNLGSLETFRGKVLLVPDHRGGRISADLEAAGFEVRDVPSSWCALSDWVQILSCADWNQDAAVLIALGKRCGVLNLNDGGALGTRALLAAPFKVFQRRFVLKLINYGDADMMNFFTEAGQRITPIAAEHKPLGYDYSAVLKRWDGTHTAPCSCHHRFARTDSCWASAYETPLAAHGERFNVSRGGSSSRGSSPMTSTRTESSSPRSSERRGNSRSRSSSATIGPMSSKPPTCGCSRIISAASATLRGISSSSDSGSAAAITPSGSAARAGAASHSRRRAARSWRRSGTRSSTTS
ncbi:MAG: hypothetical protein ACREU3_13245 [Steroidobacteraceae bacterium]